MLEIPSYINLNDICRQSMDFAWDDNLPHSTLKSVDKGSAQMLKGASDLARVGFVIACAEWVLYRFEVDSTIDFAWDYIEASWARLIDPFLGRTWEPHEWPWSGRVDGSIATSLHSITNTFYGIEEGGGWLQEVPLASAFTSHVLSDFSGFLEWRAAVLVHLVRHFPYEQNNPVGPPLPRIVLDPSLELTKQRVNEFTLGFLGALNPNKNRFLTTPDEYRELRALSADDNGDD